MVLGPPYQFGQAPVCDELLACALAIVKKGRIGDSRFKIQDSRFKIRDASSGLRAAGYEINTEGSFALGAEQS
ncbi:MAG: hypothetical protein CL693_02110 [Cellvibrionaceae bacterium]|nr:hypothetical protein [Cellvibrionaceae bacterium]